MCFRMVLSSDVWAIRFLCLSGAEYAFSGPKRVFFEVFLKKNGKCFGGSKIMPTFASLSERNTEVLKTKESIRGVAQSG